MNALCLPLVAGVVAFLLTSPTYSQQVPAFPVVDSATQKSRDNTRRQILERELATEQDLLAKAQQEFTAGQTAKQPSEKFDTLKETVARHQRNVAALTQEIARVGGIVARSKTSAAPVVLRQSQPKEQPQDVAPAPYWDVYRRPRPSHQEQPTQQIKTNAAAHITNVQLRGVIN